MGSNVSSEPDAPGNPVADQSVVLQSGAAASDKLRASPLPSSVPSYCKSYGKDKVIFLNKDDWDSPPVGLPESFIDSLDEEDNGPKGVITKSGEINWSCPCLGNLPYGPCAVVFRGAFSCFHYSLSSPKGADCIDDFRRMTECMQKYPNLYPNDKEDDDDDAFDTMDKAEEQAQREDRAKNKKNS